MLDEKDLMEIAAQLRMPEGENGLSMGNSMHEKNIAMTRHAVGKLNLQKGQTILELGHGNGGHVKSILDIAPGLKYVGLEVSNEMKKQASQMNRMYLPHGNADFKLYNGLEIPFNEKTFDHVLTVNTLYFWEKPYQLLEEIYKVLKPGGKLSICFADESFMKTLPFTKYGFELYNLERFGKLVGKTEFNIVESSKNKDIVKSKAGDEVLRIYHTIILEK
ncbi:MAG: class I SAM-dependent methyltransferase [Crocinitomicaceae bacterium]|nr:class I SAM-dependent methyltransferase [Crocinitomicaceae bacterium]